MPWLGLKLRLLAEETRAMIMRPLRTVIWYRGVNFCLHVRARMATKHSKQYQFKTIDYRTVTFRKRIRGFKIIKDLYLSGTKDRKQSHDIRVRS